MKSFLKKYRKLLPIVCAALLIVVAGIGGTLAWLTSSPGALINTFTVGKVPITVGEGFDHTTKSNVVITNTGNTSAWIRATLVPIWRNSDGVTGSGLTADLGTQCDYTLNTGAGSAAWTYNSGDGYYYYNSIVPVGGATANLVNSLSVKSGLDSVYNDKKFELQVLAQSVQALGMGSDSDTAQKAFARALASNGTTP